MKVKSSICGNECPIEEMDEVVFMDCDGRLNTAYECDSCSVPQP